MGITSRLLGLLLILICSTCCVYAFEGRNVSRISMQNGLSDNTINCIYKDSDGFMWFGTDDGLSRYDGSSIKNYTPQKGYIAVSGIREASDGLFYLIANEILYSFDHYRECFIPVVSASDGNKIALRDLKVENDSLCWALRNGILQCLQREFVSDPVGNKSLQMRVIKEFTGTKGENERFTNFTFSEDRRMLYLCTQSRLYLFDKNKLEVVCSWALSNQKRPVIVTSIYEKGEYVWVSTMGDGVLRYHLLSGAKQQWKYNRDSSVSNLSHNDAYAVLSVGTEKYLTITWNGYTIFTPDPKNPGKMSSEIHNDKISKNDPTLELRMISGYYDPKGTLWIGTRGGGVIVADYRQSFYQQYQLEQHDEICGMLIDAEQHIWLATFHEGILRSDQPFGTSKQRLHFYPVTDKVINQETAVLCATKDWKGRLWFGNANGTLTCYQPEKNEFTTHSLCLPDRKLHNDEVWALFIDSEQRFWIGTGRGLLLFDPVQNKCTSVDIRLSDEENPPLIRAIVESKNKEIWVGTAIGLRCLTFVKGNITVKGEYEKRKGISTPQIRSLLATSDGNLYIGYTTGLGVMQAPFLEISEFYNTRNGLCGNFIGCLAEDSEGRVWLGNNSGITLHDTHRKLFYNYYISGSNRTAVNIGNTLFWGNNKNLTYFDPKDILPFRYATDSVRIINLEVDNKQVEIGKMINRQIILNQGISYTRHIELNYDNRNFSIQFSSLTYSSVPQKYMYRLSPYQKEWVVSKEGENRAIYTNLPAEDYLFEVKNIYPDGEQSQGTDLLITILPHWSQTPLFRLLILLIIFSVIYYIVHWFYRKNKRIEREMRLEQELFVAKLEHEKEIQIRKERENFFTNAAHELRTPLTLILSPLQRLLYKVKPSDVIYDSLKVMYKNGTSLHTLVDELLYLQKAEAGMVKLKLTETDLAKVVKAVTDSFIQLAEENEIKFTVNISIKPVSVWIDIDKISAAIRNLLTNAFKYTSSEGEIEVSLEEQEVDEKTYMRIKVSDNGSGIPEMLQERIFETFVTGENLPSFSSKMGIGLRIVKNTMDLHHGAVILDSTSGVGSTFTLFIPEGRDHFDNDQYEMITYETGMQLPEESHPVLSESKESESIVLPKKLDTLLIIEDNEDMRKYICSLFNKQYIVFEAADGEVGLLLATEKQPNLIISDVMMPVKDGFTCCREIRSQPQTSHIPIIMLTAKAEDADVLNGTQIGVDDYMMKPFNPELLQAKVRSLIIQRRRLKQIYTKSLMLKQRSDSEKVKEDPFMQQVIQIIETNIANEAFDVNMLAEQLNMSYPTLYRKIKQHTSLSTLEVIRSIRMSKAASLIMEHKYSIQEIVEKVGFSDPNTFRKYFINQFGVPPSKYS